MENHHAINRKTYNFNGHGFQISRQMLQRPARASGSHQWWPSLLFARTSDFPMLAWQMYTMLNIKIVGKWMLIPRDGIIYIYIHMYVYYYYYYVYLSIQYLNLPQYIGFSTFSIPNKSIDKNTFNLTWDDLWPDKIQWFPRALQYLLVHLGPPSTHANY